MTDVLIYYLLAEVYPGRHGMGSHVTAQLESCPKLQAIVAAVQSDAKVRRAALWCMRASAIGFLIYLYFRSAFSSSVLQAWLESRPQTPF